MEAVRVSLPMREKIQIFADSLAASWVLLSTTRRLPIDKGYYDCLMLCMLPWLPQAAPIQECLELYECAVGEFWRKRDMA